MGFNLQSLIDKLNATCRKSLEHAAELCVTQTNYSVEVEHFLLKLLELPDSDIQKLFKYYNVRTSDVIRDITKAIERFKRGNTRTPALSPHILRVLEQSWLLSSLYMNANFIRSGSILLALVDNDILRGMMLETSPSFELIPRDSLKTNITEIIKVSNEEKTSKMAVGVPSSSNNSQSDLDSKPIKSNTPFLDQFTIDLTIRAKEGFIDPIRGRDFEIRQLIDILTRRRQNNPILTGEAGVGKTAVVEGFALRIAKGDVPPSLRNISLRMLDLGLLQAGASVKGEFEKRLKSVIDEVRTSSQPIILFIDEAHTLIGAGGSAGMGDAANLLKPALARGELRTVAATTWSEYKKYIEKDPALARRFQVVKVGEPDEASAVEMLRGLVENLEKHHNVTILDEAVREAVRLSHKYITGRLLPDKAISVLDTACARVAIGQNATPPEIEDVNSKISNIELEVEILEREKKRGIGNFERIDELKEELESLKSRKEELEKVWNEELNLVKVIVEIERSILDYNKAKDTLRFEESSKKLLAKKEELKIIQNETLMVPVCVDARIVASVISGWTGIPVGKMMADEIQTILDLKEKLSERIIGQPLALDAISRRIRTFRANLDEPGKPVGVFLLAGPSGVGKTETAIALSDILYGGDRNMIVLNMSEYQEAYTVSSLKGSPPGYVGYGKGGVLTEAVRQNPYSILLLDEFEKAHQDVMEMFYQVFDKGLLEDSEGITIDFKNTLMLLTTNAGSYSIMQMCQDSTNLPELDNFVELVRPELLKYFKPALLGRLVIVPYYPLSDDVIKKIIKLKLDKTKDRFKEQHRINFSYTEEFISAVASRCNEKDTGARNVDHILTQTMLPELSGEILKRMAKGDVCTGINVYIDEAGKFAYKFEPASVHDDYYESDSRPIVSFEKPVVEQPPIHRPIQDVDDYDEIPIMPDFDEFDVEIDAKDTSSEIQKDYEVYEDDEEYEYEDESIDAEKQEEKSSDESVKLTIDKIKPDYAHTFRKDGKYRIRPNKKIKKQRDWLSFFKRKK
ncbi:MAG: type VI secretion system ATPase TssH [Desulfobacterales bacterium]|nr:type VI secretion system ATPase TssH [Desulfobacterales bacterium]